MKRRIMTYIDDDLYDKVKDEARDNENFNGVSDFLRYLIQNYFTESNRRKAREDAVGKIEDVLDILRKL